MINKNYYSEAIKLMEDLYGKNVQMSFATSLYDQPSVRVIDLVYRDEYFYATVHYASNKMKEIAVNPKVSLCQGMFRCWGIAIDEGRLYDEKNKEYIDYFKRVFYLFYDKHVDDETTSILKIKLEIAYVYANNYKYIINFADKTATRSEFVLEAD
jgi:hypothetical protein